MLCAVIGNGPRTGTSFTMLDARVGPTRVSVAANASLSSGGRPRTLCASEARTWISPLRRSSSENLCAWLPNVPSTLPVVI